MAAKLLSCIPQKVILTELLYFQLCITTTIQNLRQYGISGTNVFPSHKGLKPIRMT